MFGMWTLGFNILRKSLISSFISVSSAGWSLALELWLPVGNAPPAAHKVISNWKRKKFSDLRKDWSNWGSFVPPSFCRLESINALGPLWIQKTKLTKISLIMKKLKNSGAGKFSLKIFIRPRQLFFFRLNTMVKHPYRGLYLGEQTFWKAIRTTYGNKLASF